MSTVKKIVLTLSVLLLLTLGGVAFAAHPCDMCGSANTTLAGAGSWCHWYCAACDYTTSRTHHPNSYNSGLVPDSCSGSCRWCGSAAVWSSHNFGDYVLNGDAACTADGTETARCTNAQCSASVTRTAAGSALGHEYEKTVHRPTCDNIGYTENVCTRCGITFNDGVKKALEHAFVTFTGNGDGTHTARCASLYCPETVTKSCASLIRLAGGAEIDLCPVCGYVFSSGITLTAADHARPLLDATELPGSLAVLVDAAPIDLPMAGDALYLFVTALHSEGQEVPFSGRMEIEIDLNAHPFTLANTQFEGVAPAYVSAWTVKVVRVENHRVDGALTEVWQECPFTLKKGMLTFETEKMGLFLLVPGNAESPTTWPHASGSL